jgi:putative flippase GtrA
MSPAALNTFIRWGKFNLVGAMGAALQLAALACFNRWSGGGHYLLASAAAIELTLLHNFLWHSHFTWRDRRDGVSRLRRFARFHLSIGLVSMLGNLVVMRILVHDAHLPPLVSNAIAIGCCSVANFRLGNNRAFAGPQARPDAVGQSGRTWMPDICIGRESGRIPTI